MEIFNEFTAGLIAQYLLEIEAIRLQPKKPFTWASGWKSPIYCDNRLSLSYPKVRKIIKEELVKVIKKNYPDAEAIAGVATAGIPQGALIADALDLPFLYVRSTAKGHGMENRIEGKISPGQKVVIMEDLVSTGGSSIKAAIDLRNAGFEILGMVAVFTYGFDLAGKNFEKEGIRLICLSDYGSMLDQAIAKNYISSKDQQSLAQWRTDPANWTADS